MQLVAEKLNTNKYQMENDILSLLGKEDPEDLKINSVKFTIINVARMDNTETAVKLFDNLLEADHWGSCRTCRYKNFCPIAINIISISNVKEIVRERVFYVYRLLFEYGQRLTMRQISGHLSYALTAGLDCQKISLLAEQVPAQETSDFLFFNRFFGYNGNSLDSEAVRLSAISKLVPLEMGAKPYTPIERQLWIKESRNLPNLPKSLEKIFFTIKKTAKIGKDDTSPSRHRQQIRRMFYIFGDFQKNNISYINSFIDSQMLIKFLDWQSENINTVNLYMEDLKRKVLHVLQEQFSGLQNPENYNYHYLFITLKRNSIELRQTAQIILAKIPLSNFSLKIKKVNTKYKPYRYMLSLYESSSNESLDLELPFLDFVLLRGIGEIGQKLDVSYIDRLERYKSKLLESSSYRACA
ncbi:hypothetical protein D1AOALGA4SA_9902 [Olavius algarvensis Delta 1 endosymbiont]|nr:hypothetical protein D1AOALGA4SA_9902 [Olavius algarvensis Delta 1 endosymbiont]